MERFRYLAIYECRYCEREVLIPRRYTYHLGSGCRCPKCGTFRVVKLKAPDKIDPVYSGLLSLLERVAGGQRYHCCFCRVQFFDRRPLAPNSSRTAPETVLRPRQEPPPAISESAPEVATEAPEDVLTEVHPEVLAEEKVTTPTDSASTGA